MADMDPTSRWANSLRENFPNGAADLDPAAPQTGQQAAKPRLRTPAPAPTNQLVPTGQFDNGYRPNFTMGEAPPKPKNQLIARPNFVFSDGTSPSIAKAAEEATDVAAKAPSLRNGLAAREGLLAKGGYLAGRAAPYVKPLGIAATGADVVSHFNDYKINDPSVDSSAAGTISALAQGKPIEAFRSLGKGAVETAMDLGSFGANTLDLVVPGKAPVSRAYDRALRDAFGDKLISAVPSEAAGVGAAPTTTPYSNPNANQTAATAARLGIKLNNTAGDGRGSVVPTPNPTNGPSTIDNFTDRAAASLRNGRDGLAWAAPGTVYKTVDPKTGTVTYSGRDVSGDISGKTVDGRGNPVSLRGSVDGGNTIVGNADGIAYGNQGKGLSAGGGVAGEGSGALTSARLAAAQRGDWDAVKSSYGGNFNDHGMASRPQGDGLPAVGEVGWKTLRAQKIMQEHNDLTRRGQDFENERAMVPLRLAQYQRDMRAAAMKQAGGDPKKAAQLLLQSGGDPKELMDFNAQLNTDESHNEQMQNGATDRLRKEFTVYGPDGKTVDEARTTQAIQLMRSLFPNLEHQDAGTRTAAMAKAQEVFGMFNKVKGQDRVGWDAIANMFSAKPPELRGMPDVRGAKTEQLSGLGGPMTWGASNGETLVTLPNKQTLNFGVLNASQLESLHKAINGKGW